MTRLIYRFKGAPVDRIGGPWWNRDFPDDAPYGKRPSDFFKALNHFFADAYEIESVGQPVPSDRTPIVNPPPEARHTLTCCTGCGQTIVRYLHGDNCRKCQAAAPWAQPAQA